MNNTSDGINNNLRNNDLFNYIDYWNNRYISGGTSGTGSYGILAEYKAQIINEYIKQKAIDSVIEFGCGDGNQLKYMDYKMYLGLDVSEHAIEMNIKNFIRDRTKSFMLYQPKYFKNNGYIQADLVVCLDVLYHIIPEIDYNKTLEDIFSCATKYVILYTNVDEKSDKNVHIYYRDTLSHLKNFNDFYVENIIKQKYDDLSDASFIILKKKDII